MIKVVLDTNVLISAFVFGGNPRKIFEKAISEKIHLFISEPLLDEIKRVLSRPKFSYSPKAIQTIIHELLLVSDLVTPTKTINLIKSDPDDNKILECAIESKADFIVTGDYHLLDLESYHKIKIISPIKFIHDVNL